MIHNQLQNTCIYLPYNRDLAISLCLDVSLDLAVSFDLDILTLNFQHCYINYPSDSKRVIIFKIVIALRGH